LNYPQELMELHKISPENATKIFSDLVELNYLRINNEVMGILSGEIKGENQEEEEHGIEKEEELEEENEKPTE